MFRKQFPSPFSIPTRLEYDFTPEAEINHGLTDAEIAAFFAMPRPRRFTRRFLTKVLIGTTAIRMPWWARWGYAVLALSFAAASIITLPWYNFDMENIRQGRGTKARGVAVSYVLVGSGTDVYRVDLEFITEDGQKIEKDYYVHGRPPLPESLEQKEGGGAPAGDGVPVDITYIPKYPLMAAVPGWEHYPRTVIGIGDYVFTIVFGGMTLILLVPVVFWRMRRRRMRRILAEGEPGIADIGAIRRHWYHINGHQVHFVHVRIESASGECLAAFKARGARLDYIRGLRENGGRLRVLFLPRKPDHLALFGVIQ